VVRVTRYKLWETRRGERVDHVSKLPRFMVHDSQWRSCCVVVLLIAEVGDCERCGPDTDGAGWSPTSHVVVCVLLTPQLLLVCSANLGYVVLEQSQLSRVVKWVFPVLLAALKAFLSVVVVPWMTRHLLVPLFQPATFKAQFKATFVFTLVLNIVSTVVIPITSALLVDTRCLSRIFQPPDPGHVVIKERLCTARGFMARNCTGSFSTEATFVANVVHPVHIDERCPAAVIQVGAWVPAWAGGRGGDSAHGCNRP